jgi:hypothetical protein
VYENAQEQITAFFHEHVEKFCYLRERWQDEKEYEDWNDYVAQMRLLVEQHGGNFLSASKRPFSAFFQMGGLNAEINVTSRQAYLYVRR